MAGIVVLGAGVCGLSAGLMLARDGHQVTVLERDDAPVPRSCEDAWEQWSREGVTQFRQAHLLAAGGRVTLEESLPDVLAALVSAGAKRFDPLGSLPPTLTDRDSRPGDERFVTFTARRPVLEQVLASAAQEEPGMDVRRGVAVKGLTLQTNNGIPHVTGVCLESGQTLAADLVVDAMGRRSPLPRWCSDADVAPMHEQSEDSGFIYYTRFFRSTDGSTPQLEGPALAPIGTFSILTIPSDNDTWSVTAYVSRGDQALKRMRDADKWTAVVWETVAEDRARLREIEALRNGLEPARSTEPAAALMRALIVAMRYDADIFRTFLESRCCLTRLGETLASDGMAERILEVAGDNESMPIPGPSREDLLALLA
jgi:2-polyprenyl-6-methoxyphenol hydroxylase-like FAD-dependent oxidoreductase